MAHVLAKAGIAPDLILCSPSRRTRETLARVFSSLPESTAVEFERSLYLAGGEHLLHRLSRIDDKRETVLLVGHNPGLQELGLWLAATGKRSLLARFRAKFPTAALAQFEYAGCHWADVGGGQTQLVGFTTPKDANAG
jgi:phosphohistidine phosphatase